MKRKLIVFLTSLFFLFTACTVQTDSPVSVSDPVVLARASIPISDRDTYHLRLEMVTGRYYQGKTAIDRYDTNWEGSFQLVVCLNQPDSELSRCDIQIDGPTMLFPGEYDLQWADYNRDGNPDLSIGQYGASNWNIYRLYTILPGGEIEELPVDGGWVMASLQKFSAAFEPLEEGGFLVPWYNMEQGEMTAIHYQWNGSQFVKA